MAADFITWGVPFIFTLAIVYGSLETAAVFKNTKVNALIAVAIAFFVLTYPPAISYVNSVLPYAVGLFVVVFFIGFVKKMFIGDEKKTDFRLLGLSMGMLLLFLSYQNAGGGFLNVGFSEEFITVAAIVLVLLLLYYGMKGKFGES